LHGVRIPSAILKIVFRSIFCFLNAVWALTSGGFRIVSDTLVIVALMLRLQGLKLCFRTQSVQLTLSSVQLTLLECGMRVSKMQSMEISD